VIFFSLSLFGPFFTAVQPELSPRVVRSACYVRDQDQIKTDLGLKIIW